MNLSFLDTYMFKQRKGAISLPHIELLPKEYQVLAENETQVQ